MLNRLFFCRSPRSLDRRLIIHNPEGVRGSPLARGNMCAIRPRRSFPPQRLATTDLPAKCNASSSVSEIAATRFAAQCGGLLEIFNDMHKEIASMLRRAQIVSPFRFRAKPRILLAKGRLMPPSFHHAADP